MKLDNDQWDISNPCEDILEPQREVEQASNTEMKTFFFGNEEVRALVINDVPWFVGKDVAEILGYSNTRDALKKHVDEEDKTSVVIRDGGSNYKSKTTLINESGLYSLVMSSKLPTAKTFKHWVTSEVLPAIRKTGGYLLGEEQMNEDELVLTAMQVLQRKVENLKLKVQEQAKRIEMDQPRVLFAQSVENADTCILVGEMAKILNQNGVKIGQNRLF